MKNLKVYILIFYFYFNVNHVIKMMSYLDFGIVFKLIYISPIPLSQILV